MFWPHPTFGDPVDISPDDIVLINNADLRERSNRTCWPVAEAFEAKLFSVVESKFGKTIKRAHRYVPERQHGFIGSQREGNAIFTTIPPDAPLIVLSTTWQYSHHIAAGLAGHQGPILLMANFSGEWPGLVGMLNLAGTLTSLNVPYSRLWSEDLSDDFFLTRLKQWLTTGAIEPDLSHMTSITPDHALMSHPDAESGIKVARESLQRKEILGAFDLICMGMLNGAFPLSALMKIGMPIEGLSQSDLKAEMDLVPRADREACLDWYIERGMTFDFGEEDATELTIEQVLEQCAMLIALARYVDRFDLTAVGVQYQQGLARTCPASDFAEGALGSAERFPIRGDNGKVIRPDRPIPHFNEVDLGSAIPQVLFFRLLESRGLPSETTLHDIRWGSSYEGCFYWDFEISGAVPFSHLKGGIAGATGYRQDPNIFPLGGSTIAGQCKAGRFIWARAHYIGTRIHMHIGTGKAVELPEDEFQRRREATSPEWPLMNATLDGVSRDQLMGAHQSNHITVAYVAETELEGIFRAAIAQAVTHGIEVTVIGHDETWSNSVSKSG